MIADGVQGANSEAKFAREMEFISGLTLNLRAQRGYAGLLTRRIGSENEKECEKNRHEEQSKDK
jgi:hypothetical protein